MQEMLAGRQCNSCHKTPSKMTWEMYYDITGGSSRRHYGPPLMHGLGSGCTAQLMLTGNGDNHLFGPRPILMLLYPQGAGHMVPQWAPVRALKMFESFLSNSPY